MTCKLTPTLPFFDVLQRPDLSLPLMGVRSMARQAGWAVASQHGSKFAGLVTGLDQTSHAGERNALLHPCLAASLAQQPVRILCDAQALVKRLHHGLTHAHCSGDLGGYWHKAHSPQLLA